MSIHTLSTVSLPRDLYKRDAPKQTQIKQTSFWDRYDSQTLIYDAVHNAQTNTVRLILPRAFNFAPLLTSATFSIDGHHQKRPKWQKWRHHEVLTFQNLTSASTLTLAFDDQSFTIPIHPVDHACAGLNTVYTLSKDNDLNWIADWASFHVKTHNLQAIVLCDNGSTAYDLETLDTTLQSVPGIQQVRVIAADLPYGPLNIDCTHRTEAKFLQIAMLNLARDRFLAGSRAWLNLDIDELLLSPTAESIFDATANDRWGHLTFPGIWHYPANGTSPARYSDHRFTRDSDAACPTKFSLRPDGVFGNFALQVHSLEKVSRKFKLAPNRFWFMHCYGISTSWKYARTVHDGTLQPASDLARGALDAAFDT